MSQRRVKRDHHELSIMRGDRLVDNRKLHRSLYAIDGGRNLQFSDIAVAQIIRLI